MESIVVPLDGSRCADAAFELALGLARARGAELRVCSVVDPRAIVGRSLASPLKEKHVAAVKADADRIVKEAVAKSADANVSAEGFVILGEPAAEIVSFAAEMKAGTIVMGTHGQYGFRQLSMGSVAQDVLQTAACPVVVVREKGGIVKAAERGRPPLERDQPISVLRLIEVEPKDFDRIYGEVATFMDGTGAELPGVSQTEVLGSVDSTRIVILAEFRSHADWVRAQWDRRLGELLEEIAVNSRTLEFGLYRGDRFHVGSRVATASVPRGRDA